MLSGAVYSISNFQKMSLVTVIWFFMVTYLSQAYTDHPNCLGFLLTAEL